MKTLAKLRYVEADEEITDLVDWFRQSQEDAVTFVVQGHSRSFQSPMSFRLLRRYADSLGKHVNVISSEPRLQALSLESGFSAYPSLAAYDAGAEVHRPGEAEEAESIQPLSQSAGTAAATTTTSAPVGVAKTRMAAVVSAPPKRPAAPPPSPLTKIRLPRNLKPYYIAAAAVALLALIGGVLYLPTAQVTLTVRGTAIAADVTLQGSTGATVGSTDQFVTQALSASESQVVQDTATGQKPVAAVTASGTALFTLNCSPLDLLCDGADLPQGVAVRTSDGKRYKTQKAASIPGRSGSVSVPISAVASGAAGNTDPGSINTIEGNDQHSDELKVTNPNALTNGADARTATVIQQADIDSAVKAANDLLAPKVSQELTTKANGLHLVPVTDAPKTDIAMQDNHKVGDEIANFTFTITISQAGVAFDDQVVRQMILNDLKLKVTPGYQLTRNSDTSYDVSGASADGKITVTSHAKGYQVREFSIPGLRAYIKGRTPSSAVAHLRSLPNVVDAQIHQSPFGLWWLPFFSSRISVEIQEVTGSTGT